MVDAPQHSPGPWTVRSDSHIVGPTGLIGEVLSNFDRDSHSDRYLADALLMAAAPELLEAAHLALGALEDEGADLFHTTAIDALRAAIAKATT